ncbi:MAG: Zinc ribbon domain protein [candidate division TA06 bacterium ADurb.Bin417]|uniref:Zinc ribbon domain protein n=1 Tax=candidate division TA06 bacterium ADurb.Bin417 TaxID=1852828 RepID=A0A1V5MHD7_UNCT6|nr:MAG: Zinc ribbon domain protein [candidate division TA06 bacterium ADurb.Bin417]
MPIFCYRCRECEERLEILVRSAADEPEKCLQCGGRLNKEFASFAIGRGSGASASAGSSCAGCSSGACGSCHSHK